jgi:hypothetical protein
MQNTSVSSVMLTHGVSDSYMLEGYHLVHTKLENKLTCQVIRYVYRTSFVFVSSNCRGVLLSSQSSFPVCDPPWLRKKMRTRMDRVASSTPAGPNQNSNNPVLVWSRLVISVSCTVRNNPICRHKSQTLARSRNGCSGQGARQTLLRPCQDQSPCRRTALRFGHPDSC